MTTVRELAINLAFDADTRKMAQVDDRLEDIKDEAKRGDSAVKGMGKTLRNVFVGLGIGAAVAMIGRKMVGTISKFQQLRAQMETIEGSAEKAESAFNMLQEFASTTPFQLQNVVESFARLRAVGLEPTMEDMTAMGDIAAGMGKDVLDFADAVTAATTGEAERLKQFGIIMRTQGEQVKISFKGQTQTIKKDATEISQTLFELGRENFAGGMARQAGTIGGAFSNLQDNIAKFFDSVGRAGFAEELVKIIKLFTESASGADSLAYIIGKTLAGALATVTAITKVFLDNLTGISIVLGTITTGLIAYGIGLVATKFNTIAVALATGNWSLALGKVNLQMLLLGGRIMFTVGLLALMLLAVEDLVGFLQGKDSILGDTFTEMGVSGDESIQLLIGGLTGLMVVLLALAATVGLPFIVIIGLIGLLIGLIYYLSTVGIDAIIAAFENFGAAVGETLDGIWYLLKPWLDDMGTKISEWASSIWDPVSDAFSNMIDEVEMFFLQLISLITDEIADVGRSIGDAASNPLGFVADLIGGGAADPGVDAGRRDAQVNNSRSVAVDASIPITIQNNGTTVADNDALAQDLESKIGGALGRLFGRTARDLEGGTD